MSGFGGGMMSQNRSFKQLLNNDGPDMNSGPSFNDGQGGGKDLGSVQSSGRPPSGAPDGPPKPVGGGLGYSKLLGNLMKLYNPMQQGRFG